MDPATDWTVTALFSPSKARAHQAQARDWAAVDSWLSKKYASHPRFERNEDTLQALLALANLNDGADEQQTQVERVEKAALQSLSRRSTRLVDEIYHSLLSSLDDEEQLVILAEAVISLNCANSDTAEIGKAIVELNVSQFDLEQQLRRADAQLAALQREQLRLRKLIEDLHDDSLQAPDDIVERTAEWTKSSKHLRAKIAEYDERLSSIGIPASHSRLQSVHQKSQENNQQRQRLGMAKMELNAFQDLPVEPQAARMKLEEAREQLRQLTRQRDRLFEGLVAGSE